MLNAKQRQTHYLFDITVLISKIKRRLTRVPAVKGRLPPRPRKHSRFSALRQRAARAGGPGAEGAVIGNIASVPRAGEWTAHRRPFPPVHGLFAIPSSKFHIKTY